MTDSRRGDTVNPWTIGVARLGNGPAVRHDAPQHRLTITRESTHTVDDHYINATDAIDQRVRRLKDAGIKHQIAGDRINYTDPVTGDHITLTYTETRKP